MRDYRVMMRIDGAVVPSSCIKSGPLEACNLTAERLNRNATQRTDYVVLPCVSVIAVYSRIDGRVTDRRVRQ